MDFFKFNFINTFLYMYFHNIYARIKNVGSFVSFPEAKSSHGTDPEPPAREEVLIRSSDFHKKASQKAVPLSTRLPGNSNHRF